MHVAKKEKRRGRLVPRRRHCSKFGRLVGHLTGWAQTAGREEAGSSLSSTYGKKALVLEQCRGQVALTGIGEQCDDGLALVLGALG